MNTSVILVQKLAACGASPEEIIIALESFDGNITIANKIVNESPSYGSISSAMNSILGEKGNVFSTTDLKKAAKSAGSIELDGAAGQFIQKMLREKKIRRTSRAHYMTVQ